mmetsp:Transcript_10658/g.13207  ORF Transcript_10658/g.13207 Transcript_10658/m.13207 type:complete len:225 (+) Transcript_10658:217-891(+)
MNARHFAIAALRSKHNDKRIGTTSAQTHNNSTLRRGRTQLNHAQTDLASERTALPKFLPPRCVRTRHRATETGEGYQTNPVLINTDTDSYSEAGNLEELLLLVGLDGAVRGGVGHAGEAEALAHLVVVKEGAVRLVNGTSGDLARAGRAGARAARVRQVDAVLLGLVEHVGVIRAIDVEGARRVDEGDGVHLGGRGAGDSGGTDLGGERRVEGEASDDVGEHGY